MEEYLTTKELAARIKYREQTLYNLVHRGTLVQGEHYIKPTPKKLLFRWSAIKDWLGEKPIHSTDSEMDQTGPEGLAKPVATKQISAPHRHRQSRIINI